MQIEVGSDTLKIAGAIKYHRAQPGSVRARAHDRHVALVPLFLKKSPGLGKSVRWRQSVLPHHWVKSSWDLCRLEAAGGQKSLRIAYFTVSNVKKLRLTIEPKNPRG